MKTLTEIAAIAPQLWAPARELAHSLGTADGPAYAVAYVESVARICGGVAADQCADGEAWAPTDWLAGDIAAVREASALVGVVLDEAHLWAIYCEGDTRAAADYGAGE